MSIDESYLTEKTAGKTVAGIIGAMIFVLTCSFNIFSSNRPISAVATVGSTNETTSLPDTIPLGQSLTSPSEVIEKQLTVKSDSVAITPVDTVDVIAPLDLRLPGETSHNETKEQVIYTFNPNPTRAVWLSALCPGLGQLYNRRYWKLPIVVGGFMGLGYATSWNNTMLRDYTRAYSDILDNDPNTKSYMDFFPPTTKEEDLDKTWLTNILQSRKNYFRRNRDLCIIGMIGVYLVAMIDAYVDASLAHFDISPDLSMQLAPAVIQDSRGKLPSVGIQWAFNF